MSDQQGRKTPLAWWGEPASGAGPDEVPLESGVGKISVRPVESPRSVPLLSEAQLAQLAFDLAERLKPPDAPPPPDRAMFGELAHAWFERVRTKRVDPKNEERAIARLRDLFLEDETTLTAPMIEALLETLTITGTSEPISASTRNKIIATGRRIIAEAQRQQMWGAVNPFSLVKRSKEEAPKPELLTLEELAAVQPRIPPQYLALFRLALHLGMRPGELFALRKDDVDWARGVVHVRASHERDETKTGKDRTVPILGAIAGDLRDVYDAAKGQLLFTRDGERLRRDTKMARVLHTAMAKAGVGIVGVTYKCRRCGRVEHGGPPPLVDHRCDCGMRFWAVREVRAVRWYDLRHMCATFHHRAGADPTCVSLALGHSIDGSTTQRVYTHPDDATMRRELSKWSLPPHCKTQGTRENS